VTVARSNAWYHRERAKDAAKRGEKLIDRMAFWRAVPIIGARITQKIADRLDCVTDEAERWIAMGV
jgi:hypothetical protein